MTPPNFPRVILMKNNIKVVADYIKEKHVPALFGMAKANAAIPDTGVSPTDYPTEARFRQIIQDCDMGMEFTLEETGEPVGFTVLFPCEMCRSCRPVSVRCYTLLDPKVTNMGLGPWGARIGLPWAKHRGFPGMIARNTILNDAAIRLAVKVGMDYQGWIPNSFQEFDGKWHDELITTVDIPHTLLQGIKDEDVIDKCINHPVKHVYNKLPFKGGSLSEELDMPSLGTCNLQTIKEEDLRTVYEAFHEAAIAGECFGIDEFPSYEIFTSFYLKERIVVKLTTSDNSLVAAAVLGPARLCRTSDPVSSCLYMLIKPEYRNKGIGTVLAHFLIGYIKQSGYRAVLTDALMTESISYRFITRLGFSNIGCVPKSAYVSQKGYTDSLVFYLKIGQQDLQFSKLKPDTKSML